MSSRVLKKSVSFEGIGLHSGEKCKVTLSPSENLLNFSIDDRNFTPIEKLKCEGSARGTDLIFSLGARVRTVEHLLSAVGGLGLWRTSVCVEGVEIPAMDGCAETFANELFAASEPAPVEKAIEIYNTIYADNGRGATLVAMPSETFRITYIIKYENPLIGTMMFDYSGARGDFFMSEISRSRTFALERDIKALRENGMALGGSLENAILVGEREIQTVGGLRHDDEFVRHKVLDLIGDLTLIGRPLKAHVVAIRAGHAPHLMLVEKLRKISVGGR